MPDHERQMMLDAFRDETEPAASELSRSWGDLSGRIQAGDVGMALPEPTSTAPMWKLPLVAIGGGAGTAGLALGLWLAAGESSPPTDAPEHHAPVVEVAPPEPVPLPIAEPVEPEPEQPATQATPSKKRRKRTVRPEPSARADTDRNSPAVAEEMALMVKARRALRAKSWARAQSLLSRHERDYPQGLFEEERMASLVLALCGLGRQSEAEVHVNALQRGFPESASARRLAKGCPVQSEAPPKRRTKP